MQKALDEQMLHHLSKGKHLLAFSAGSDSSALYHLLSTHHITFDIAIVEYPFRLEAAKEVTHAKALAEHDNRACYHYVSPPITKNIEQSARDVRYHFFKTLMQHHGYASLITAHHFNDQLEWFFMQLSKGAGLLELIGMQRISTQPYITLRPLLNTPKEQILHYLHQHNITYFNDVSNHEHTYLRNQFRDTLVTPLMTKYATGLVQSMEFLTQDADLLKGSITITHHKELILLEGASSRRALIFHIDKVLKQFHLLLHRTQKELLLKHSSCEVSRSKGVYLFGHAALIFPLTSACQPMPKAFKEQMRKLHVPPPLRSYFLMRNELISLFRSAVDTHSK